MEHQYDGAGSMKFFVTSWLVWINRKGCFERAPGPEARGFGLKIKL